MWIYVSYPWSSLSFDSLEIQILSEDILSHFSLLPINICSVHSSEWWRSSKPYSCFWSIFWVQCRAGHFKCPGYNAHNSYFSALATSTCHPELIHSLEWIWRDLSNQMVACCYCHHPSIDKHEEDDNNVAFLQRDFVNIQHQCGSFHITLATWFVVLCDRLAFTRQHVNRWLSVAALLSLIIVRR